VLSRRPFWLIWRNYLRICPARLTKTTGNTTEERQWPYRQSNLVQTCYMFCKISLDRLTVLTTTTPYCTTLCGFKMLFNCIVNCQVCGPAVIEEWMRIEQWWNDIDKGRRKYSEKTLSRDRTWASVVRGRWNVKWKVNCFPVTLLSLFLLCETMKLDTWLGMCCLQSKCRTERNSGVELETAGFSDTRILIHKQYGDVTQKILIFILTIWKLQILYILWVLVFYLYGQQS
jgi:hypothetical protein